MSSQRGNVKKKKPPKYQNKTTFKNSLHDTSKQTKTLNSMTVGGVCDRCKDTIEWKIKYKKYKPLTQPKKCTKCSQKTVKHAYHIICAVCARDAGVCAKCATKRDSVTPYALTPTEQAAEDSKMEAELKALNERKRRAFFRWQDKGFTEDTRAESEKEAQNVEDKEEEVVSGDEDSEERQSNSSDGEDDQVAACRVVEITDELCVEDNVHDLDDTGTRDKEDLNNSVISEETLQVHPLASRDLTQHLGSEECQNDGPEDLHLQGAIQDLNVNDNESQDKITVNEFS